VHVSIGCDIVHEQPIFDGAAIGEATYRDFLIYANTVENLEGGVFLNLGSAVTGPEVYLKALSMARNVARQQNRHIGHFTTAVFDLLPLEGKNVKEEPLKSDPRYYFRLGRPSWPAPWPMAGKAFMFRGSTAIRWRLSPICSFTGRDANEP
jgi:hypothetical protein